MLTVMESLNYMLWVRSDLRSCDNRTVLHMRAGNNQNRLCVFQAVFSHLNPELSNFYQ